MRRAAVHQVIPTLADRDAIGRHTMRARSVLRTAGYDSDIYASSAVGDVAREALAVERYRSDGQAHLVYQCSTGSPLAAWLLARPEPLILDYHNITPAELFAPWEPQVAVELASGRQQLAELCRVAVAGLGDSAFNVAELDELGCRATSVAPVLLDEADLDARPDPAALDRLRRARGATWLFVGRVAPHKGQHDVLKAFAAYREVHDPHATLHLVGGVSSSRYASWLADVVSDLELDEVVHLSGSVSQGELAALYRAASVFVCLSDHEGFCVPLLEAMHHRLPVVAFAAGAVPETLADGGLLLDDKRPFTVVAAVHRVLTDDALRERLVAAGAARVADMSLARAEAAFLRAITAAVER